MRFVSSDVVDDEVRGKTIVSYFRDTVSARKDEVALRWRDGEQWPVLTWAQYAERACRVAAGLAALGVQRGDKVSLMLRNRPEFHIVDTAALLLGATATSIYYTSSPEQVEYQLRHAGSVVAIVDRPTALDRVLAVRESVPGLRAVVCIDDTSDLDVEGVVGLDELEAHDPVDLEAAADAANPDDIATIIYTSGTTGPPKGVQLSQHNVVWTVESQRQLWGKDFVGKRVISYLPTSHVAERMNGHYVAIVTGFEVTDCPEPQLLAEYLLHVRPHLLFCPPRFWEKLREGMRAIAGAADFDRAIEAGKQIREARLKGGEPPAQAVQDWQELEPRVAEWKAAVGLDALEIAYSAAASGNIEVIDTFAALGTPLAEAYGMSETATAGTGDVYEPKLGYVGRAAPGVEIKLAEDGEILVRCGGVMVGYLNDPEKTAEAIDEDGWLYTGDVGEFDDEGYLKIIDRKKDLIINSYGKNISPVAVESALNGNPLFTHPVAIGEGRKYVTALLVSDPEQTKVWAKSRGLDVTDPAQLAQHPAVLEEAREVVDRANTHLSKVEQVKRFRVLPGPWVPDSDVLTPLAKLKRHAINAKYAAEIEEMYAETPSEGVQIAVDK